MEGVSKCLTFNKRFSILQIILDLDQWFLVVNHELPTLEFYGGANWDGEGQRGYREKDRISDE